MREIVYETDDIQKETGATLKRVGKIIGRVAVGVVLTLYVGVALLNYSLVQTYVGKVAGGYFSRQWDCEVSIGSISIAPWSHLNIRDLLLVAPDGDTILDAEKLYLNFRRFPYRTGDLKKGGNVVGELHFDRVLLANAYYHFESFGHDSVSGRGRINLNFIIDHYRRVKEKDPMEKKFRVEVGTLTLRHIHYRMDLPDKRHKVYDYGVEIPHMEFFDVCGKYKDVKVLSDEIETRIVSMSAKERSGFRVENIKGRVKVGRMGIMAQGMEVHTDKSHIYTDARLDYGHWNEMKDYCHTVDCHVALGEETTVAMSDVAYWAPVLKDIDMQVAASGRVSGTVANLRLDSLKVDCGKGSGLVVDGVVKGLPSIDELEGVMDYLHVRVLPSDIKTVASALRVDVPSAVWPWMRKAGWVDITARMRGKWKGVARVDGVVACGLGMVRANATTAPLGRGKRVSASVYSRNLNLQPLATDWLTQSGVAVDMEAAWHSERPRLEQVEAKAEVRLENSTVRGQHLSPINMHVGLNGGAVKFDAKCADSIARFAVEGRAALADSVKGYYVSLDLQRLQADAFRLLNEPFGTVSGQLVANFKGNSLDGMQGALAVQQAKAGDARLEGLTLTVNSDDGHKDIKVESELFTATLGGKFAYADLPLMARRMAEKVLPSTLRTLPAGDSTAYASIEGSNVAFNVQWIDKSRVLRKIAPKLTVASGTRISGSYNHYEMLKVAMRSEKIGFGSVDLHAVGLMGRLEGDEYRLEVESPTIALGQREVLHRVVASLVGSDTHTVAGIVWGSGEDESEGDLMFAIDGDRISVVHPRFRVGGSHWEVGIDSLSVVRQQRLMIDGRGLNLHNEEQRIGGRLQLQGKESDHVELDFDRFKLSSVSSVLLQGSNMEVAGRVDGHFSMYGFGKVPYFNANLTVDSCVVNSQQLGNIGVRSNWNAELNTLNLQVSSEQLQAQGWLGLGQKDPELDFTVDFDKFELAMAAPFLTAFASKFGGQLHGSFDIGGTWSSPEILGEAKVENGQIRVEATGVTYYFNDSLQIDGDQISLNHFRVADHKGHVALLDGTIRYGGHEMVELNLGLQADSLLVLDRTRGSAYSGTLLVALQGEVKGNLGDLHLSATASTRAGSTLTIPVSSQRQVKSQGYIVFVEDMPQPTDTVETVKSQSTVPFNIELDIAITPDLVLNLPMDFSEVAVNAGGSGFGSLHVSMVPTEELKVLGNYEINSGVLKLSMLSLFTKNFTIERGSNIVFSGAIPDARFDLKAVHSQRVNLSTLTGSLSSLDNTQKYLQVENIIGIAGTLREPTVGFDLRLPNADASVEEEVFAYIDRSSERDMINQTMSLLLRGQFYNSAQDDNSGSTNNSLSSGYSMLASSVSSIVSDMVQFVDVDVNYKAGNDLTNDQLDVNISKDWGKWYIESTLGYGGESREIESSTANGTIIDALIGYRLSPLIHLFAYNRTNTNDYTRSDMPYKQGAGVKLTKDFDHWGELLWKYGKKEGRK